MIAKGKAISHTAASIEYGKNKKEILIDPINGKEYKGNLASKEIDRNLITGETAHEIASDMAIFQRGSTIKNTTFSFVVSPSQKIGDSYSSSDWSKLTREFLYKLGYLVGVPNLVDEQPYISFLHTGSKSKTKHLHIYVNRILTNNRPITDKFIGKKSSLVAEQIARERGYKTAKQVRMEKEKEKNLEPEAFYIRKAIEHVLNSYPSSLEVFLQRLNQWSIKHKKKYDSKNKLRGLSFIYKDKKYKATEFHRNLSGNKIEEVLKSHYQKRSKQKTKTKQLHRKPKNNLNRER